MDPNLFNCDNCPQTWPACGCKRKSHEGYCKVCHDLRMRKTDSSKQTGERA